MSVHLLIHSFYSDGNLLFTLESAAEYDTATPYRYAVSRFVELAQLLSQGETITIISQSEQKLTAVLQTVEDLWYWLSYNFKGFEKYIDA